MNYNKFLMVLVLAFTFTTIYAQKYHDAAAFDAYGHVKWILTDVGVVYFNEDGQLNKAKSSALSDYSKFKIERDASGFIKKITTDFETQNFTYTTDNLLAKKIVKGNSNYSVSHERDSNRKYQTETTKVLSGRQENTSVKYLCHEDNGNWFYKSVEIGGNYKTEKRVIGYWFNQTDYKVANNNISVMYMLNNPGLLTQKDIFKYNPKELKQMYKEEGYKVKASFLWMNNYAYTFHGLKLRLYIASSSSSKMPYMSNISINHGNHTNGTHILTLVIDELLKNNIPLKTTLYKTTEKDKGYGVWVNYNGHPCTIIVNVNEERKKEYPTIYDFMKDVDIKIFKDEEEFQRNQKYFSSNFATYK